MKMRNLTPNPFPRGKGNRMVRNPFARGKGNRIIWSGRGVLHVLLPFPRGKGPGVRFLISLALLLAAPSCARFFPFPRGKGLGVRFLICALILTLAAGCAQVHDQIFTLDCAIGRAPLPGEMSPGTAMALDVSTSPVPLLFPPHRAIARCDNAGVVTLNIETPVDTGLSQLTNPLSTAASHVSYAP